MKVDDLEPAKATFFRGTTLFNFPLLTLYHEKRITKAEVATILGVHENYITYIYENLYLKRTEDEK
jgi:hypothetical protein